MVMRSRNTSSTSPLSAGQFPVDEPDSAGGGYAMRRGEAGTLKSLQEKILPKHVSNRLPTYSGMAALSRNSLQADSGVPCRHDARSRLLLSLKIKTRWAIFRLAKPPDFGNCRDDARHPDRIRQDRYFT
jgi:hypothetical protein